MNSTELFQHMDESFNGLVDNIEDAPKHLFFKNCETFIGGFPIQDQGKIDDKIRSFTSNRTSYVAARTNLKKTLETRGVKAKAFIPLRVWDQMCDKYGLFRMKPDRDGEINVNVDPTKIIDRWADSYLLVMGIALLVAALYIGATHIYPVDGFWLTVGKTIIMGGGGVIALGVSFGIMALFSPITETVVFGLHLLLVPKRRWLRNFLPEYKEAGYGEKTKKIGLILPKAPQSVTDTLTKLNGLVELRVAADAAAIRFTTSPYALWKYQRIEDRKQFWADFMAEPIIYMQQGNCIAVIEQFGDFPMEKKAVDSLINLEFLL